jgi:hypothetical protein
MTDFNFEDPAFDLLWADAMFVAEYGEPDAAAAERHAAEINGGGPTVFLASPEPEAARRAA